MEKVKKILQKFGDFIGGDPAVNIEDVLDIDEATLEICHLIPKSPDNPDGYEPKPLSAREAECKNCLKSIDNGGACEDLNCADYPCPSQEPKFSPLPKNLGVYSPQFISKPEGYNETGTSSTLRYSEKEIPRFKSEDEERAFWANNDSVDFLEGAEQVNLEPNELPATGIIQEGKRQGFEAKERASTPETAAIQDERLLTEKDLPWLYNFTAVEGNVDTILEMQDAKTASIKEVECQARVERIFREFENKAHHTDLIDTIRVNLDWLDYQALKKKEGVRVC